MKKQYPEARSLSGNLLYVILKAGNGPQVAKGAVVDAHFTGFLSNGDRFADSRAQGGPIRFVLGKQEILEGWDIGMEGMRKGETRRLLIPYPLAYGEQEYRGVIPARENLVFDMELVDFKTE